MALHYNNLAKDKTREDILKEYDTLDKEKFLQNAVIVRCTDSLEESSIKLAESINKITASIDKNSESSNKLSSRLYWLNIILAIITSIGVIFTIISVFKQPN